MRKFALHTSAIFTLAISACAPLGSQTQTGLIYDSANQGKNLDYDRVDQPYSEKAPMSATAAANRWLEDTRVNIEMSGAAEMRASLKYFIDKLREKGALVELSFPVEAINYSGPSMPRTISARDMLTRVSTNTGLAYVASYTPKGKLFIKLHRIYNNDDMRPTEFRTAGLLESISVRKGESLISISQRISTEKGYTGVLFDFSPGSPAPHSFSAPFEGLVQGNGITGLLEVIKDQFKPVVPDLKFFEAKTDGGYALVVTNREFQSWENLRVFDVLADTLSENARRLSQHYGWKMDPINGWRLDTDYTIVAPYKIVVSDVHQAFSRILEAYPVKANLVGSTETVFFVERPMPVAHYGAKN